MKKHISILALSFLIQACQSSIVIPKSDGSFEIRSQGSTNHYALQLALSGAESACKKQGRTYVVENQNVLYRGAISEKSKNLINQVTNITSTAVFFNSGTNDKLVIVPQNPASTDEDYEAILQVRCQ